MLGRSGRPGRLTDGTGSHARTKANAGPYPATLRRDTIRAPEIRRRMRRREFIVGLAMLTNAHGASAQGRARRVGALVVEQTQANILETVLKQKGWILGQNLLVEYRVTRGDTDGGNRLNIAGRTAAGPYQPRGRA